MSVVAVAESRHHDVRTPDGRTLHVYEAGDPHGEVVLAHHGTPACGLLPSTWADDARERGVRLVSYDRPGYGGSGRHAGRRVGDAAADAAAIADALGVGRFRTWGGSGGGPHSLACAALLGDRVIAAGVIASPTPYGVAGLDWMAGMGQDNIDEFGAALAGEPMLSAYLDNACDELRAAGVEGITKALESLLPPADTTFLARGWGAFLFDWMTGGLGSGTDGWLDDDLAFVRPWGFDPSLIAVPIKLVHGRHDKMVPFAHGQWLAEHIPHVAADLLDDEGHLSALNRVPELHGWLLERSAPTGGESV